MSLSFKKIKTKWTSTERVRNQKIAVSTAKIVHVHIGALLTLALFSIVYLVSVNTLATKGYTIREIERAIVQQKKDNERLGLEIIEKQSMSNLQKQIDELGMVSAGSIRYLSPTAAVASAHPIPTQ